MKSLCFLQAILLDAERSTAANLSRDFLTITRRVADEGESFLTITLPTYADSLESALHNRCIGPSDFLAFKKSKNRVSPVFLQGLLDLIFNPLTGVIKDEPDVQSIFFIRQVCRSFKKIERPCTTKRVDQAKRDYISIDGSIPISFNKYRESKEHTRLKELAYLLWRSVIGSSIQTTLLLPRHGPGAVQDKKSLSARYASCSWFERANAFFPYDIYREPYGIPISHRVDTFESCGSRDSKYSDTSFVKAKDEPPVRVITVPKTQKGPRTISIEPDEMMYCQQAVLTSLVPLLESSRVVGKALKFTDQRRNQEFAKAASKTGSHATLDLSEASDRIGLSLVSSVFNGCPQFLRTLMACRSFRANVDGEIIRLNKFASMGSALCFPVEAMVFYTITLLSMFDADSCYKFTLKRIRKYSQEISIFGDDIIVPTRYAANAMLFISHFGLKINERKSFFKEGSKFRESCGVDAYDGVDITPVYIRTELPQSIHEARKVCSSVSTRNQFYRKGLWATASYMDDCLAKAKLSIPIGQETSPGLVRVSFLIEYQIRKYDSNFRPVVRSLVLTQKKFRDQDDPHGFLMEFFVTKSLKKDISQNYISTDVKLYERVRPDSARLIYREVTPF